MIDIRSYVTCNLVTLYIIVIFSSIALQARMRCTRTDWHSCSERYYRRTARLPYYFRVGAHAANMMVEDDKLQPSSPETSGSLIGESIRISLGSGYMMPAIFFNRQSDILLVLGPGLNGSKEGMACFVDLFDRYDVIVFDYRWQTDNRFFKRYNTLMHPFQALLFDELEEVQAILRYATSRKKYAQVIGLAECYSAYLFAVAQLDAEQRHQHLFTKLILDSCWLSIPAFAERIAADPWLAFNSGKGGAPKCIRDLVWITGLSYVARSIARSCWSDIDSRAILGKLTHVPLLFIHGQRDEMVPVHQFEQVYTAVTCRSKAAVYTPYTHSRNMHDRSLYKTICEKFIDQSFNQFSSYMRHKIVAI